MVAITYRTLGPWGGGKGANLQPSEVDSNFYNLAQALVDLESNPAEPKGIETISVSGSLMTITLTNGDVMGPFTLPTLTFRWRGEFEPYAPYAVLDVFTVSSTNPDQVTNKYGVFLVQTAGAWAVFDANLDMVAPDDPNGAFRWLFGSSDMTLVSLGDVDITGPLVQDSALLWDVATQKWVNIRLGSIARQDADAVNILGGAIHNMPPPTLPGDVATKAYVDALPLGMTVDPGTMMSNISGLIAPAIPNTLSDYLDYVLGTTIRGTMLYRSGGGWVALPPGTAGYYLQTAGPGFDVTWGPGGAGITAITAGTGIDTTPDTIVSTGSVALAAISDKALLANVSGSSAAPTPTTVSAFLDAALTNARGTIITRTGAGWVALAPGTAGYYLKTQGAGADAMWDAPAGSGTVTSISGGTGISTGGSPITGVGTVSLAAIADDRVLANISGGSAVPGATSVSALLDATIGSTQGSMLYRSAAAWVALSPGSAGQFLATGGAAADLSWEDAPITGSAVANLTIFSNVSGGSPAVPTANTLTDILDAIISSARGTLLYRTNSGWVGLAPGTAGQVLQTGGAAADPSWTTNGGGFLAISSPAARDILVYNSSSGKFENARPKYEIGCYVPGVMTASQNLLFHRFSKAVTLPANLGAHLNHNTIAGGSAAATGSTAITLAKALAGTPTSFSTVATLTIAPAALSASLSTQAAISFAQGDVLRVRGPATADVTFADFHMSLVGFET